MATIRNSQLFLFEQPFFGILIHSEDGVHIIDIFVYRYSIFRYRYSTTESQTTVNFPQKLRRIIFFIVYLIHITINLLYGTAKNVLATIEELAQEPATLVPPPTNELDWAAAEPAANQQ